MSEPPLLWYASYGSNLFAQRFSYYLRGGRPVGAARTYPGARDSTPPRADRALRVPGQVFFGWHSPTWGGGIAFLDTAAPAEALLRGYLITHEQFCDVLAQEMHRDPGQDLDLSPLWESGRWVLGPGRYETLVVVGEREGSPVVTFTCPEGPQRPELNAPTEPYVAMIAAGLAQTHQLSAQQVAQYLNRCPGLGQHWSTARLAALLR
ncbi:histone deacetylase [Dermacoccaceae bacterium W4C1]